MKVQSIFSKKIDVTSEFGLKGLNEGHHKVTYRGVPCLKCPMDYVIYQMIINEIEPDLIIEIGTNIGGSALYLADILSLAGKGEVHSIDIDDRSHEKAKGHPRIKLFHDGWGEYDLDIARKFRKIMVIEDSSHEYENTLKAIERFAQVVSKDSYLIVEDGVIDALGMAKSYNGGPVKAIKEFLSGHPEFILDTRWSDMFGKNATFNTIGYLKRI